MSFHLKIGGAERRIATIIVILVVYGVFFPPESYFSATGQMFSTQAATERAFSGILFGRIGYAATLIWFCVLCVHRPAVMLGAIVRNWMLIAFGAVALASAYNSADFYTSLNRSLRLLIVILFAIYIATCFGVRESIRVFIDAMLVAVVASVVAVIVIPRYGMSELSGYTSAWRGALGHKNALGGLMCTGAALGFYAWRLGYSSRWRSMTVFIGCFVLAGLSQSATSIVALCLSASVVVGLQVIHRARRIELRMLLLILGGAIVSMIAWIVATDGVPVGLFGRSATLTGRTQVWEQVEWAIALNPVKGYGHAFWSIPSLMRDAIWRNLSWAPPHAHNTFLDVWLQLGLPGMTICIALFLVLCWRSIRLILVGASGVSALWVVVLVQMFVRGTMETIILDSAVSGIFWLAFIYAVFSKMGRVTHSMSVRTTNE